MFTNIRKTVTGLLTGLLIFSATTGFAEEKKFGGVGLQVVPTANGHLVVLRVLKESPAKAGTLCPGDLIVEVDGFALEGSDFTEVVSRYLWGDVGSSVTLKYLRPGKEGANTITLRRIPIDVDVPQPAGVRMITPSAD